MPDNFPLRSTPNLNSLPKTSVSTVTSLSSCIKAKEHLDDPEEAWETLVRRDQNRAIWHQLDSPCLEEEKCWVQPQAWMWKPYALGVLLWGQDDFTILRGGWMGPCTGRFWLTTSFPQWEHWKWVFDGSSNMTMTQNIRPRQQRSGSKRSILRSWGGLASLQT